MRGFVFIRGGDVFIGARCLFSSGHRFFIGGSGGRCCDGILIFVLFHVGLGRVLFLE